MTRNMVTRLSGALVVAASVALLAASAAATQGGFGPHDPWFNYAISLGTATTNPFVTDTLAPGGSQVESYRFTTDTLAPGGGIISTAPAPTGFDWRDAGIGAAGMAGLLLMLLALRRLHLLKHTHGTHGPVAT